MLKQNRSSGRGHWPYEVSAVRKALEILCSFTREKPVWSLSELSTALRIPKSTAHNLLRTLEGFDVVRRDPENKRYHLGLRLYELGLLFSSNSQLVATALPHLRRLAEYTQETVKLGVLSGGQVLVAAAVESSLLLNTRGDVGSRWPLHSTSLGKAILAALSRAEVHTIVRRQGLPRFTEHTTVGLEELEQALDGIRERGFALDLEENELGVRCAAVPLTLPPSSGGFIAALSVSGPSSRLTPGRLEEFAGLLADAARIVSASLSWPRPSRERREGASSIPGGDFEDH
jgi:IclR family transcriptional regulator, KDG regulon repressor